MSTLYILQNQHGYYLRKKSQDKKTPNAKVSEWVDGQDLSLLFRTIHKDEAINMQFEVNTQDIDLRITIKEYPANTRNYPDIPQDDLPPPLPKQSTDDVVLEDMPQEEVPLFSEAHSSEATMVNDSTVSS